jgi:hypothetical protein
MIAVRQQIFGFGREVVGQIRNLLDHSQSTKCRLYMTCQFTSENVNIKEPTFFRMYVLLDPSSFSISLARSRDISSEAMFANVHSARPTAYMLE